MKLRGLILYTSYGALVMAFLFLLIAEFCVNAGSADSTSALANRLHSLCYTIIPAIILAAAGIVFLCESSTTARNQSDPSVQQNRCL